MKKVFILVITFLLIFTNVSAKDNKLEFTEDNDSLYYDSSKLDKKIFMNHVDMTPGKTYTDELVIQNKTNKTYNLYFKVDTTEQAKENDELLENIDMKITLDGKEIYDGRANGLDYNDKGIDLQDAIELGEFAKNKSSKIIVEIKLREEYKVVNNLADSIIDWTFFAQYEDEKPVRIIESSTNEFDIPIMPLMALVLIVGIDVVLALKIRELKGTKKVIPVVASNEEITLEIPKIKFKSTYKNDDKKIIKDSVMPDEKGKLLINDQFDKIDEISAGDKAIISYKDTKYTYTVLDKYYIKKDGYVEVDNNSKCNTLSLINRNDKTNKNTIIIILYVTKKEDR